MKMDSTRFSTLLGILAIALWATTTATERSVAEHVGPLTAASCIYLVAGCLGCGYLILTGQLRQVVLTLPKRYLLWCGGLFVAYTACLFLALGLSASRQQAIEAGVINYLWPGLTLFLSVPMLGKKSRPVLLVAGSMAGFTGVLLLGMGNLHAIGQDVGHLRPNLLPYGLALGAAVIWALYSNLCSKWASGAAAGAVPLFLLATGVVLSPCAFLLRESSHWTPASLAEIAFVAVFPTLLGYVCWEAAMRNGRTTLVVAVSYLIPVLSTLFSSLYLAVLPSWNVWLTCGLVVIGGVTCKFSVGDGESPP